MLCGRGNVGPAADGRHHGTASACKNCRCLFTTVGRFFFLLLFQWSLLSFTSRTFLPTPSLPPTCASPPPFLPHTHTHAHTPFSCAAPPSAGATPGPPLCCRRGAFLRHAAVCKGQARRRAGRGAAGCRKRRRCARGPSRVRFSAAVGARQEEEPQRTHMWFSRCVCACVRPFFFFFFSLFPTRKLRA